MANTNESKAIITKITATSRAAVKIRDNYFTIEYAEERSIPTDIEVDMDSERTILWDEVNRVVDDQIEDIINTYKNKN